MDTDDRNSAQRRHIMELNRWKLIAGGAALVGVSIGGAAAAADSDEGFDLNDRQAIELTAETNRAATGFDIPPVDLSPESPDSPNESPEESPDSPFDSPDDEGWVDPSPESPDSPNESPEESPDSPSDSPDDEGWVDPSPESPESPDASLQDSPQPAPAPAPADDSPGSPDSPDSPNSADS
jgi:hypothetical protein